MAEQRIEPTEVVAVVERYVYDELSDAEKYTNREPLDESGIWSLHALAARIYAMGWADGERSGVHRSESVRGRMRDAARKATDTEAARPESETDDE